MYNKHNTSSNELLNSTIHWTTHTWHNMNTTYSTYKKAHNNLKSSSHTYPHIYLILDTQTCIQHTAHNILKSHTYAHILDTQTCWHEKQYKIKLEIRMKAKVKTSTKSIDIYLQVANIIFFEYHEYNSHPTVHNYALI